MNLNERVNRLLHTLHGRMQLVALEQVKWLAEEALELNPNFHTFKMEKGNYYHFYDKDGAEAFDYWTTLEIREFIEEWDDLLKLTDNELIIEKSEEEIKTEV